MIRRALARSPKRRLPILSGADAYERVQRKRSLLSRRRSFDHGNSRQRLVLAAVAFIVVVTLRLVLVHRHVTAEMRNRMRSKGESLTVSPLRDPIDYQQYTIRINTWKRQETLKASLEHHVSCPGVAQIQVIWCLDQGPPPDWLRNWPGEKVVVELHDINSLNERFVVQKTPPTAAILSIDDDIIRPCIAYDWAFYKWTKNPDRIVGFDARAHEEAPDGSWKYEYLSPSEKANRYSLILTRCSFVHVDYLDWYATSELLAMIRDFVDKNFNCEDIGMSLAVSSQTNGQPPLLADFWAIRSAVELHDGKDKKISDGKDHKQLRDQCLDQFALHLGLKGPGAIHPLRSGVLKSYFEYGHAASDWNNRPRGTDRDYLLQVKEQVDRWKSDPLILSEELAIMRKDASKSAYKEGLVEGTGPWTRRFKAGSEENTAL